MPSSRGPKSTPTPPRIPFPFHSSLPISNPNFTEAPLHPQVRTCLESILLAPLISVFVVVIQSLSHVKSDSLQPHGLQCARLPCPSLSPRAQTHVHFVSDCIKPSHPLLPASPPALNLSQHQSLFQGVGSLHQVAKAIINNSVYFLFELISV